MSDTTDSTTQDLAEVEATVMAVEATEAQAQELADVPEPHKGDFGIPWSMMTEKQRNVRRWEMRNKSLNR